MERSWRYLDKLSLQQYWDEEWRKWQETWKGEENYSNEEKSIQGYYFNTLFKKYLPHGEKTYLEIGCAPGSIMVNFAKNFRYRVSGIDYSSGEVVRNTLKRHKIMDYDLIEQDFLDFETVQKFDVVASFGFVEHFEDYNYVIAKQASLVKQDGFLIVQVPNIRYFNYLLFRLFFPHSIKMHNLKVMDLKEISYSILKNNEFDVLFCNYYKSCFIFFNTENSQLSSHPLLKKWLRRLKTMIEFLHLDNIANKFFSPYIIMIAKKVKAAETF